MGKQRMRRSGGMAVGLIVASLFTHTGNVHADMLEKLVMPGPLAEPHARYENECSRCHEAFDKKQQRRLCLVCHKDVARDIDRQEGFHGRTADVSRVECNRCHPDHVGRSADIVGLDAETFDHARTDFALHGAHVHVECAACHTSHKPRETPSTCIACHRSKDPHRGALGEQCADCHSEERWNGGRFDHTRTSFVLDGAHARSSCAACHPDQRYANTPKTCAACHGLDDVHRGTRGNRCEQCHTSSTWKRSRFDHAVAARFPLRGSHARLACAACHKGGITSRRLPTTCDGCHRTDDPHRGQQGTACERCHNEDSWARGVRFDHDLTRFPLLGAHAAVGCEQCHPTAAYKGTPTACTECHARQDAHAGRLGLQCGSCHNPNGWRLWSFDHGIRTSFALTGAHAGVACEACHTRALDKAVPLSTGCLSCHANDDVHRGAFGPRCELCHSTTDFSPRPVHR